MLPNKLLLTMLQVISFLPEVWALTQNEDLCKNYTFWQNLSCNWLTRCTGNFPGQCFERYGNKAMLKNMTQVNIL